MHHVKKVLFAIIILTALLVSPSVSAPAWAAQDTARDRQLDTLFLGTKGENSDFFLDMLNMMMKEHVSWRQGFHPEDPPAISNKSLASPEASDARKKLKETLATLSTRLQKGSNPWFSDRYLGHMTSDLLLPGVVGYMAAMLYNANNVVYEASPATTEMELEVGLQLARLLGYDTEKAWGNITSGGTNANFQALWYARNLKSFPLAVKAVMPELVKGKSTQQLQNMPIGEALNLLDKVKESPKYEDVLKQTVKGKGVDPGMLGKLLVPQSRHYSWDKGADVFGIGSENIIAIPVDKNIPAKKYFVYGINDGLKEEWEEYNWLNPPFKFTPKWVYKAVEQQKKGRTTYAILPVHTEAKYFKECIWNNRGHGDIE